MFYLLSLLALTLAKHVSAQHGASRTFSLPMIRRENVNKENALQLYNRYGKRAHPLPDEESFFHDIQHYYCWSPITVGGQQLAVVLDTSSTELYELLHFMEH